MDLLARVRLFISRYDLVTRDAPIVAAVSGGSDSVALAHLLHELDASGELRVAGLAHFNHQLRPTAERDEQFSRDVAKSLGVPIVVEREDVAARAKRDRQSIEAAARMARHAFFGRARAHFNAGAVALGHTRDDQAETVLLRLVRGAGLRGLAAMHPKHGALIRPLLSCRRRELQDYLASRGIAFVVDESNADVAIPRNRVRAELMPLLESRFNPRVVEVLADEAQLARETLHWIEAEADKLLDTAARPGGFDIGALNQAPAALRRFALWRQLTCAAGGKPVSFDHVEAVLAVMRSPSDSAVDLPGQRVERAGPLVVLRSRDRGARGRPSAEVPNLFEYPLSIPGEVVLSSIGWVLTAESLRPGGPGFEDAGRPALDGSVAVVRGDLGGGPWRVRSRRPGDRFQPVGLGGCKKLQDFFVDCKVPRARRDEVPLVVDGENRIVWVAGHGIDETFRVTDSAQAVVVLRLKLLGGPS